MNDNIIKEMTKMRSLMERIEKPRTGMQAILSEEKMLTEGVERRVESPDKVFDILDQIGKNDFVCIGAVSGANLALPTVKRKNPETNRMKTYDDYETLAKNIGSENEIAALVKITSYNFRYYNLNDFNKQYSQYKQKANEIRPEYGLEPIADKEEDYREKMEYGNGINVNKNNGNFYVPYNGYNVKPKGVVYAVNSEGHIVQELTDEQVLPYLKKKDPNASIGGVSALRKMGVEEDKIEEYIRRINDLKFSYKQLEGNAILWVAATVAGQKIVYINSRLSKSVNGIDVNPEDFVQKAIERYKVDVENMPEA